MPRGPEVVGSGSKLTEQTLPHICLRYASVNKISANNFSAKFSAFLISLFPNGNLVWGNPSRDRTRQTVDAVALISIPDWPKVISNPENVIEA